MTHPMLPKRSSRLCIALGLLAAACSSSTQDPAGTAGKSESTAGSKNGSGGGGGSSNGGGSSGSSANGGQGNAGTASTGTCVSGETLNASATNNFKYWSKLTVNTVKVKPQSDLSFDWSAVTSDFYGLSVDPKKDILVGVFSIWPNSTPEQFAKQVNEDALGSPPAGVFAPPDALPLAKTSLFEMQNADGKSKPEQSYLLGFLDASTYTPSENCYTLTIGSDMNPEKRIRMVTAIQLDESSSNTEVKLDNDTTKLDYGIDGWGETTLIPSGKANITVDWSGMETKSDEETDPAKLNSAKRPFKVRKIKEVKIGRFTQSEEELKDKSNLLKIVSGDIGDFFAAEIKAGSSVDLSTLQTSGGESFKGIDKDHRWLLALINSDSKNPAPWYLTFLQSCN